MNKILEWIRKPYNIYLNWYGKKWSKKSNRMGYYNQYPKFNPFTILQFYLVFLTVFIITGGIIMTIILMIQSLT